ncbi:hypothetical protein [Coleofasciculus sp. H7-2]|uniref:hypothetical protein n=1 Tax=Coleofasciculus sp. H7-2 TaxID=3351545 RepID=UPI00366E5465
MKKLSAGLLLTFGGLFLMIPLIVFAMPNPNASPEDKQEDRDAALGGLVLGLPAVAVGGWLVWGLRKQHSKETGDRLQSTFYRLLTEGDGSITALQFAMETKLTAAEAKQYLDDRAKEYDANFKVSDEGGVSYYFLLK